MTGSLREAAFGATPGADVPRLLAAEPSTARHRWLAAVALGGQGRYAAATALLRPLLSDPDPVLASLAASTLGSHRRQLGWHAAARRFDAVALGRVAGFGAADPAPDGVCGSGARLDALLGLAADAVGAGVPAEARRLLERAEGVVPGGWRGTVRLLWVTAEVALAEGRAAGAVGPARSALSLARVSGALRHITKSEAVLATALHATATKSGRDEAVVLLKRVAHTSLDSGMLPLAWPSALLLAELRPAEAQQLRGRARNGLRCILGRSDVDCVVAARKSPWMPTTIVAAPER